MRLQDSQPKKILSDWNQAVPNHLADEWSNAWAGYTTGPSSGYTTGEWWMIVQRCILRIVRWCIRPWRVSLSSSRWLGRSTTWFKYDKISKWKKKERKYEQLRNSLFHVTTPSWTALKLGWSSGDSWKKGTKSWQRNVVWMGREKECILRSTIWWRNDFGKD